MAMKINSSSIEQLLREDDPLVIRKLYEQADAVRAANVGNDVHLRALLEMSNVCRRQCTYCGIAAYNAHLTRYRMSEEEIIASAHHAAQLGFHTLVLQSGEDTFYSTSMIIRIVRTIKEQTGLAITLSLGERTPEELAEWKEAGANRYLLRFETSDINLFQRIHPPAGFSSYEDYCAQLSPEDACMAHTFTTEVPRMSLLRTLRELDYEVGSGVMVGIPGQTYATLARDICTFQQLDLDMIGVGPYIPHPDTPLGKQMLAAQTSQTAKTTQAQDATSADEAPNSFTCAGVNQVPNTADMTLKVIALTRLVCPKSNIPATTALGVLGEEASRIQAFECGANVIMPNVTPLAYRSLYSIYEGKDTVSETEDMLAALTQQIINAGRTVGTTEGKSRAFAARHKE